MSAVIKSRKSAARSKIDATANGSAVTFRAIPTTRTRLLEAAVDSLIELGVARTSTLEVQRRTGLSRGALLHHFPSYADLLAASVSELVSRNEQGARRMRSKFRAHSDPLDRAVRTLAAIVNQPSYLAELELWAVSRTDTVLRTALRAQEQRARIDSERVCAEVFFSLRGRPGCAGVMALSLELLRGLALSGVLRTSSARREALINQWVTAARTLLEVPSALPSASVAAKRTP